MRACQPNRVNPVAARGDLSWRGVCSCHSRCEHLRLSSERARTATWLDRPAEVNLDVRGLELSGEFDLPAFPGQGYVGNARKVCGQLN